MRKQQQERNFMFMLHMTRWLTYTGGKVPISCWYVQQYCNEITTTKIYHAVSPSTTHIPHTPFLIWNVFNTPSLGNSKSVPRFRFIYPKSPAPDFSLRWAYQGQMQFRAITTQHTTTLIKQQPCHPSNQPPTTRIPSSLQNRDKERILM